MTEITRRHFFFGSAALLAVAAAPPILVPEKKVRRFWFFDWSRGDERTTGLRPIPGQPGMFEDRATGQFINIRDFKESDRYDTIVISGPRDQRDSIPAFLSAKHVEVMESCERKYTYAANSLFQQQFFDQDLAEALYRSEHKTTLEELHQKYLDALKPVPGGMSIDRLLELRPELSREELRRKMSTPDELLRDFLSKLPPDLR